MLINRDELARKVLEGEITSLDDLNAVLRSMIKDVVETAMGAEMTGFLGYDRYQTPESGPGNRRNGYSQKELASKVGPIVIDVPRDRKSGRTLKSQYLADSLWPSQMPRHSLRPSRSMPTIR